MSGVVVSSGVQTWLSDSPLVVNPSEVFRILSDAGIPINADTLTERTGGTTLMIELLAGDRNSVKAVAYRLIDERKLFDHEGVR